MTDKVFNRTDNTIKEVVGKINELVKVYAKTGDLLNYLKKQIHTATIEPLHFLTIEVYEIDVIQFCVESKDLKIREYFNILNSFVSDSELQDLLISRYFPDYLTIKNIFSILLYEIPRKIKKTDLEYLNKLYKKYNVEI